MRPFLVVLFLCVCAGLGLLSQLDMLHTLSTNAGFRARRVLGGLPFDVVTRCSGSGSGGSSYNGGSSGQALGAGSTSLVAVCSNRSASLMRVLPSWLVVRGVSEILILEWGNADAPLGPRLPRDSRVRLVRAPLEREWNLARAYNLALQLARSERILKVDSDTWLAPEVLEKQPLQEGTFLRGCRDGALDENGRHLNGVMLVRRADVLGVLGYDERMRGYGYDDTDLYHRLSAGRNLSAKCLSFTHMRHSEESHGERGLTHIHHILHRRATTELFKLWHEARLAPSKHGNGSPDCMRLASLSAC